MKLEIPCFILFFVFFCFVTEIVADENNEPLQIVIKKATQGDSDAQYELGYRYWDGNGVPRDTQEAVNWFRKAAQQGYLKAQMMLGTFLLLPSDLTSDEALMWCKNAAERGDVRSLGMMGATFENGRRVPQDFKEALKWYLMAAELGDPKSMVSAGHIYQSGRGVPQNFNEALKWFHKAANLGSGMGQAGIGDMYMVGEGVPQDTNIAIEWYQKALVSYKKEAENGDIVAETESEYMEEKIEELKDFYGIKSN